MFFLFSRNTTQLVIVDFFLGTILMYHDNLRMLAMHVKQIGKSAFIARKSLGISHCPTAYADWPQSATFFGLESLKDGFISHQQSSSYQCT